MKNLREKTERYLREFEKTPFSLKPVSAPRLPLVLRERYKMFVSRLFGREWLLAMEADGWEARTPTEYRQHLQQIAHATGKDHIAVVLPAISAKVRNRMVQMNIPFIVPNTQIYLPLAVVNLKESYRVPQYMEGKALSPAAQVLFLFQLQRGGLENQSFKEISRRVGYSRGWISAACAELEQNDLCRTFRKGKEQRLEFNRPPGEMWEAALPLLRSPVRKTYWVTWTRKPLPEARLAGISALSRITRLADDRNATYALKEKAVQEGLEKGHMHSCIDPYEADVLLEAWSYDPALISEGDAVDRLSLFLSLRENPDERVQSALADMMEGFPWR
ncbi:MAG TPA: hypothetical protein P5207_00315 [Candidatus Sabulitectum sp.]|nr:hypothetical protein [Candidatus Sabulitectum sp.]HRW77087.1 hypothetical protein [Candidatus Sabulitectum sp.]